MDTIMEKDENGHLKNQVMYITNTAYEELHSGDNHTDAGNTLEEEARDESLKADLNKR
ncbi:hypothetical protein [Fredinandcohnia sp. 179-A 10B2 NHS]|uniref:hypothetical protein n=1 Tax=Fredinandcohnia sp. 179-A 10B2 NHS TaxID=3235176 RepID=UPI0039A185AB